MDYLPQNPAILKAILHDAGYVYSEEQEQFRPIGYDEN